MEHCRFAQGVSTLTAITLAAYSGIGSRVLAEPSTETFKLNSWVTNMDDKCGLSYNIDWKHDDKNDKGRSRVENLAIAKRNFRIPDGIYIYVWKASTGEFLIRPNDRGTTGIKPRSDIAAPVGDVLLTPEKNPVRGGVGCDWKPANGATRFYARHSQLAGGGAVIAAGMLQMYGSKALWISNESGHYKPDIKSVRIAAKYLRVKNYADNNTAVCEVPDEKAGRDPSGEGTKKSPRCPDHGELVPMTW